MRLYREENILGIIQAIELDEYECSYQRSYDEEDALMVNFARFVRDFRQPGKYSLDLGCGDGNIDILEVTHAIEPSRKRYEAAKKNNPNLVIEYAVAECIPDSFPTFSNVLAASMLFQVRSQYETFIEVNGCLETGGRFLFTLETDDDKDIVVGQIFGPKNFIRCLSLFGFELVAHRRCAFYKGSMRMVHPLSFICVEKVREFEPKYLNQPQVVEVKDGLYKLMNFDLLGRESRFS